MSPLPSGGYLRALLAGARGARLLVRRRGVSGGPGCARDPSAGAGFLRGEVDRFGGVSVRLGATDSLDAAAFQRALQAAVQQWRGEGRIAVWLHVPILQSRLIAPAAALGFCFHHAEATAATLTLWLGQGPSRLPGYATHQVGVAGAVFDENTRKILVVQDRNKNLQFILGKYMEKLVITFTVPKQDHIFYKLKNMWKFPGGLSEPGEDIGDTAVREVFEETGVRSEFRSLLSLRQQHSHPGAFGRSDMYLICRLQPRSFAIRLCPHECLRGEWMDLASLATAANATPVTRRAARLLLYGHREGFDKVDLTMDEFPAVYTGLFYKLYHRELPDKYKTMSGVE